MEKFARSLGMLYRTRLVRKRIVSGFFLNCAGALWRLTSFYRF
jgi:hypothetical protein